MYDVNQCHINSNFTVGPLGGAAMLLFGGERKGGATILAAKVYLAGFFIRKVLERGRDKLWPFPWGCWSTAFLFPAALQPPSTVDDETYYDHCNLLCAPVRTISIVRLPSALAYLVMAIVILVLLGLKRPMAMHTWLVHDYGHFYHSLTPLLLCFLLLCSGYQLWRNCHLIFLNYRIVIGETLNI